MSIDALKKLNSMARKTKVLLCSPSNIINCGISRWTNHILKHYEKIESHIELDYFYPILKGVYNDTPFISRIWIGTKSYIPFLVKLNKKLINNDYDVLHFISSASIALLRDLVTLRIAKKRKVNTVIHFRFGRIPEICKTNNWERYLLHNVIKRANRAIVIDEHSYKTLRKEGYKNIELLPNPLSPQISEIVETNSEIEKIDNKILFVGHNVVTKGVNELIDACKTIPNINLKLIGYITSDMKKQLNTRAGAGYEKWFEIAGEQDFETTIKEMLSAGVFALPTYTEGFPNVIIESMACGCPIVTTNVGAIPEMLDIKNGLNYGIVIESRNITQLREALVKMINDRKYALQCGLNAQQRVNKLYAMNVIWGKMEKIWENLEKSS